MFHHAKFFNICFSFKNSSNYNTTIKIRKLTLICYSHLIFRPHSSFATCPSSGLHGKGTAAFSWLVSLVSFQFEMVPHSCLDLTLLKMITGHLICRTFLKLGTSGVSPDSIQVLYLGTSITKVMLSSLTASYHVTQFQCIPFWWDWLRSLG